jgi:uncharacterized protein YggT (Ycf19 family)
MVLILGLLPWAIRIVTWLVIASVVLSMIGQAFHGSWVYSPFFWGIIQFGRRLCEPVRRQLERWGLPSRPLDWSPMIVVFGLNFLEMLVNQMLFGRR